MEQLHSGLHYPQFLQQAVPVAVQPFDFGFAALASVPPLIIFRMIDIHGRDHRAAPPCSVGTQRTDESLHDDAGFPACLRVVFGPCHVEGRFTHRAQQC